MRKPWRESWDSEVRCRRSLRSSPRGHGICLGSGRIGNALPVGIIETKIAGLSAAYHLTKRGRAVRILEKRGRIGGRALTLESSEGGPPIELGAEFIHGSPDPTLIAT